MGAVKDIEKRGKRLLIRLASRAVKTAPYTPQAVRASDPRRILVVRQHNQMGDMLLATPAYRAIKESFGPVEVGVVTAPINRDVLVGHPYVDDVFTYNNRDLFGTLRMIRAIRRHRYDLVIILHTVSFSFTSALIGLLSGARIRVGSTSRPFGNALSEAFYHLELPLPAPDELAGMNEAEHNLYPLRVLGIDTEDISPLIVPSSANRSWALDFLGRTTMEGRKRLVVHPGAGKAGNVWPPENFADVVNKLNERFPVDVCVIKGPRDEAHVEAFGRAARAPYVLVEKRPIGDVAALLERADLALCNDTGIMHVSCAVGAKTLAVFGPTDPVRWAPRCANLSFVRAEGGDLRRLGVGPVLEKAQVLLELA
jgi:ADP-heptose:LPS heptosyltransferase